MRLNVGYTLKKCGNERKNDENDDNRDAFGMKMAMIVIILG